MSVKQDRTHVRTPEELERKHNWGKRFAEVIGLIDESRDHVDKVESGLRNEITNEATAIRRDTQQIVATATKDLVKNTDFEEYKKSAKSELQITADGITAKVNSTEEKVTKAQEDISDINDDIEVLQKYKEDSSAELEVQSGSISAGVSRTEEIYTEITKSIDDVDGKLDEEVNTRLTFQTKTESDLELLSDSMNLRFEKTETDISDVNGKVESTETKLSKHFEFGPNGLTIKSGESRIKLRIDNGMIGFYNGDIDETDLTKNRFGYWDGEYFHTGSIVVKLNERAQFGDFAFVPRSNGSLDFLKVGG